MLDNDTNTVVRISVGIGLLIDLWKIPKIATITVNFILRRLVDMIINLLINFSLIKQI